VGLDSQLVTHLEGALAQTSPTNAGPWNPQLVGWIQYPNTYAPKNRTVYTVVQTLSGTYSDLAIKSNGEIWLLNSPDTNTGFVSLEGISYYDGAFLGSSSCTYTPSCVQPLTLNPGSGWSTPAGYGSSPVGAWEDGNHTVHLEGAVSGPPGSPDKIGSVPATMVPYRNVFTIVHTLGGTYADLSIDTDGSIWLIPSANTRRDFVSLEGITYTLQPPGIPGAHGSNPGSIALASGWVPTECCGSLATAITPSAYTDPDGIVHLYGAVNPDPGAGDEIGTLPMSAWPFHNIYTVVHTTFGTFADLQILTDGTMWLHDATGLLAPGVPAVTNRDFVSLEGVTFPQ
jgi:hypothetical protein